MSSGAPRAGGVVPEACAGLRWATWNARALSHSNLEARSAKVEFLRQLAARTAILALQETKAKEYGLVQILRSLEASHWVLASGESDSVGGVATLVARTLSPTKPEVVEHIRGRILEARLRHGEGELSVFCVHNFELGNQEVRRFSAELHKRAGENFRAPLRRRALLMGDLNFSVAQAGVAGAAKSRADRMLASALERWLELPVPGPTHVSPDGRSFSNIDRVWVLLPRSLLAVSRPRAGVIAKPEWVLERGLSDHSPVAVEWPRRNALPLDRRPVPRAVAEDSTMREVLERIQEVRALGGCADVRRAGVPVEGAQAAAPRGVAGRPRSEDACGGG